MQMIFRADLTILQFRKKHDPLYQLKFVSGTANVTVSGECEKLWNQWQSLGSAVMPVIVSALGGLMKSETYTASACCVQWR